MNLKRCPFCGSSAPHLSLEPGAAAEDNEGFYILCEMCKCCGPDALTEAGAAEVWNRRPQETN